MQSHQAVETILREAYSRLVAYLYRDWNNVANIEDALSHSFLRAMEHWQDEIPEYPEAWLLRTAKNYLLDSARSSGAKSLNLDEAVMNFSLPEPDDLPEQLPDDRLHLLYLCADPKIDVAMRTPLMLQMVLGVDAARIGSAFLVSPTTMGQRLVREKAKLRTLHEGFTELDTQDLPERSASVLQAIYAAYVLSWGEAAPDPSANPDDNLASEAIWLAQLVTKLQPQNPEALGLYALLLFCEARTQARFQNDKYVPLNDQDRTLWNEAMMSEAEFQLSSAARINRPGRFQLEAAIQSAHNARLISEFRNWDVIEQLYTGLIHLAPSVGAYVGRAAAIAETREIEVALNELDSLPKDLVQPYQPYWATRANLLRRCGKIDESKAAYAQAIGLMTDPRIRDFLIQESHKPF